jgi:HlyD family secretion protein
MKKKVIIFGVMLVVLGIGGFVATGSSNNEEPSYKTVKVTRANVVDKALAVGEIVPRQEVQVKSQTSGIVKILHAEIGDVVEAGDPLLVISPNPTPLEYAEAKRGLDLARVDESNAEKVRLRYKGLFEKHLISAEDYDIHTNQSESSKLRRALAEERLALLEVGSGKGENIIRSPIAGTILERLISEGDPVVPLTSYQAGTPLLTMAPMTDLIFKGTVDEIDVGKLGSGMDATLKVGALPNVPVEGLLTRISPKARKEDNATLFDLEIEIKEHGDATLRAGYSATADIIINKKDSVLVIPERLVTFAHDSATVEVLDSATQTIALIPIEIGLSDGLKIEVTKGLSLNDLVVERPPKEIE